MFDFLQFGFMQRALVGGLMIAVICPVVGVFLVLRRLALIGDGMAHVAFGGIALGMFLNTQRLPVKPYPVLTALGLCLLSAVGIHRLQRARVYGDVAIAIFFSFGLALGVIFISLSRGFTVDLFTYLFGNILLITPADLVLIAVLGVVILGAIALFYKELFFITFDEESAQAGGVPVQTLNLLLIVLIALTVVVAMRIVGLLLVSALLVIPAATALQICRSFRQTIGMAVGLGVLAVMVGLFSAYRFDISAGGSIVVTLVVLFFTVLLGKSLNRSRLQSHR
ncbi:MAG: metal ABC transporter permease [Candidatus Sumerlaeia bacterium]